MGSRYYFDRKRTVETCDEVSVFFLKKHGYFSGDRSGTITWDHGGVRNSSIHVTASTLASPPYVHFAYAYTYGSTGEETNYDYKVQLLTTSCHKGGIRYWFSCPLSGCGRRVGKLYFGGGAYLACRHCYNLTYTSRTMSPGSLTELVVLDLRHDKLLNQIKRWTYRDMPTRKARRLDALCDRLERTIARVAASHGISGYHE